ncbi:SusD/RagB family nutrient-binding outer membrane lipoprotein [Thalassobellus sediminis]|uniref:SusD/RagB family nutrient-binding outer membrane lipoprotein n=1 Tax=Thalassobellus sediminis TaxID=3367753 RepID=UPI00378EAD7E
MKTIKQFILIFTILLFVVGCDDNFEAINTDPYQINDIEASLIFAGSQRTGTGGWGAENTIVQHYVNPYNTGATLGFNFNENIDAQQNGAFGNYTRSIKEFTHILNNMLGDDTDRINLKSMVRIWKAQVFMIMVDAYGDIPYFEAGKAIDGKEYFYPSYDDDEAIYEDLHKELKEAVASLSSGGEFVEADLFYGINGAVPSTSAAQQVAKWQKLGNSLLLRLGMRYTKVNSALAQTIVNEAVNGPGGVMTSNNDNAFVRYDGSLFTNGSNNTLIAFPYFHHAAEPFVEQLKTTNDPRGKYLVASFEDPADPLADPNPDYDIANQFGVPVGVEAIALGAAPYRGLKAGGLNYSEMNVNCGASILAPTFWVTYSQTSLLLAEAVVRGYISGSAQAYYEDGITANMDVYATYITETGSTLPEVSLAEKTSYLSDANVDFTLAVSDQDKIDLISIQYWITNIKNPAEAWANMRRSNHSNISRNSFNNDLLANGGDGFVHRFTYPDSEQSANPVNYSAAVSAIGGKDDLVTRIFWDVE